MGCPFDGPPYYVGFDAANQSTKKAISLKAIPYFRIKAHDDHPFTEELYDYYRCLPSDAAKKQFTRNLDDVLLEFL